MHHINMNIDPWTIINVCNLITWTTYERGTLNGFNNGFLNLDIHEFNKGLIGCIKPMHV
jgi:hypothetical protein